MGLRRYGRYLLRRLERLTASPHMVAAGVAAGAAVSVYPLIGFHFILGFVLAFLTRGSMLAAALGTAFGNPLTFPLFFSVSYQIGRGLLPGRDAEAEGIMRGNDIEDVMGTMVSRGISEVWPVWKTMMVGAIPLSIATYVILYCLVRWFVARTRSRRLLKRQARRPL
jgi:uncharacterized protein